MYECVCFFLNVFSGVANLIIGRGHTFIYLCSQTIKNNQFQKILIVSTEHKYMSMCPPLLKGAPPPSIFNFSCFPILLSELQCTLLILCFSYARQFYLSMGKLSDLL